MTCLEVSAKDGTINGSLPTEFRTSFFCMVLGAIMFLFAPHTNSQRFAYKQVEGEEKGESSQVADDKNVWADEGGLDEEEDDSFWASTHGKGSKPEADILGKQDDESKI